METAKLEHPLTEATVSAVFVFVAGYVVWPPTTFHWEFLEGVVGGAVLLALLAVLCVVLGAAFAVVTGVRLSTFVAGGIAAYLVGMWGISRIMTPDSPVHFVLYGVFLVLFVAGVAVPEAYGRLKELTHDE